MKIGIISNLYPPYMRGGAEKVVATLSHALAKENQVFVITSMPYVNHESLQSHLEEITTTANKKITIYRFFPLNIFYYLNDYQHHFFIRFIWNIIDTFNFHSYFTIKKILQTEKPDIIYAHNLKGLGLLTPLIAKKLNIKYLQTLHDVQYAIPSGLLIKNQETDFLTNGWPTKIYRTIVRYLFKDIKLVVAPSEWLQSFYRKHNFFPQSTNSTIPNPIDLPKDKQVFQIKKPPYKRFLFVGQIEKHKGIEWVLNNITTLNIELTVIGVGQRLKFLQNKYQNEKKVIFTGYQNHEELKKHYRENDYLIVPSLCYENAPTVITEALTHGLPIVASNLGGIPEMVGKAGFLFEANNDIDLQQTIKKALNVTTYDTLSKNAREQAEKYSLDNYLTRLQAISSLD